MNKIKTYESVVPQNETISFEIKKMETIYDKAKGEPDEPHRHDYYIIILVKSGKGKHIIDFHEFELADHQVYFISPGQVHQLLEMQKSYGYAITFSKQFMLQTNIETCFIEDLYLFQDYGYTPPLSINEEELTELAFFAERILEKTKQNEKFKYEAIGAWLKLFLIECQNLCTSPIESNTQKVQAAGVLLKDFKALLEEKFQEWHKVSEYAKALNVSADYLNTSIKSLTGKTVKVHIQNRIVLATKRMLLFSTLSNKEIAYKMGFSEPANFSQFFKKHTGKSPSYFKSKQ